MKSIKEIATIKTKVKIFFFVQHQDGSNYEIYDTRKLTERNPIISIVICLLFSGKIEKTKKE